MSQGIYRADAVKYTMHGCNWPDIPGIQRQVGYHQAVLPQYVLEALFSFTGELPSIEALYARFAACFRREEELKQALRDDFEGCEWLRQRCLRAPKFGQDDVRADAHAARLLTVAQDEIDQAARLGGRSR